MAQATNYNHRSAVQKLGVKPSERVEITGDVGSGLRRDVKDTLGRGLVRSGELDGAIVAVQSLEEAEEAFEASARGCATPATWVHHAEARPRGLREPDAARPRRQAARSDRQQDLLDRRAALGHPLRRAAPCAAPTPSARRLDQAGARGGPRRVAAARGLRRHEPHEPIPHGPPTLRHPASDIEAAQTAEEMRAQLVVASSLYGAGRRADSQGHMNAAQQGYTTLTGPVSRHDPVLDREINAAFGVIAGQIAAKEAPPQVTNRMGLMQAEACSTPRSATPWTSRLATTRPWRRCSSTCPRRARPPTRRQPRNRPVPPDRGVPDAFGLLTRALAVARNLSPSLGPERRAAINVIGAAHNDGFPLGVLAPHSSSRSRSRRT